jgi:mono/diheme cytochrome c family protein
MRLLFFAFLFLAGEGAYAQDGKALFQANCAQCHNPIKVVTGPALKGVSERVPDPKLLHAWIHNNQQVLASGNVYFNNLYHQYGNAQMNTFPGLTDAEIDAILKYVNNYPEPLAATNTSTYPSDSLEDHSVLYGIATFVLALFAFGLYQLNVSLKKLADKKRGIRPEAPIPFYRNKAYITLALLVLFVVLGFWMVQLAVGLGRSKGYQPVQPIFFSHKVHAGLNQINCLLCHGGAWDSKQATVPSLNMCMNCHAAINDYRGERLEREDGTRVDPNEEIKKLYSYTGYDPGKGKYTHAGRPVEWIRVHNLPAYVFFSHAQHVRAGKVQCQTCHGPVQEMNEVRQFAELSMGWCINCHRTTKVDFPGTGGRDNAKDGQTDSIGDRQGNKFYSIYRGFSRDLRTGKIDSVTVEDIGGTECQKCHY